MRGKKTYLSANVYDAAVARITRCFEEFDEVMVAFSGGKDSTVLLHLAVDVAERLGKLPVRAMFVDLEGQYKETIRHVAEMFDDPRIAGGWHCVPLNLRNAVSHFEPHWGCWDPDAKERWIRPMPDHPTVVNDPYQWAWYHYRMEFEEYVPKYEEWLAETLGKRLCVLVGIRSDESLNRFRTIVRENIRRFDGLKWTTAWSDSVVNAYPIYDWGTEDIWTYIAKFNKSYNRLYDYFYLNGESIHEMRICQPYGDDQRIGLDQFHAIEPETWERILARVPGVNFGALYANDKLLGYRGGLGLPDGMESWKSYTKYLLNSLPPDVAHHYREKFLTFMLWWKAHGKARGYAGMFDSGIKNPSTGKNIPSWQRMALCILRNDYWCHSLKFGQIVRMHERQNALKEKYKDL